MKIKIMISLFLLATGFIMPSCNHSADKSKTTAEKSKPTKISGDLTGSWVLFVDDYAIASKEFVERSYHQFSKYANNPVLAADKSWEGTSAYLYGTVLPDEINQGYRMWYQTYNPKVPFGGKRGYANCYAVSKDGIHWTKPNLGVYTFENSTDNNLFLPRKRSPGDDHNPQVIYTPWEKDMRKRYKMITFAFYDGYWGSYSPDGIHWKDVEENPVFENPGDVGNFNWDPHRKRYTGYSKIWVDDVRGFKRRCVAFTETTNFESWQKSKLILVPDEYDDRWTNHEDAHTDFYGLSAFAYESMYLGFLWIYRIAPDNNRIHIELVSSHDGINWNRQEEPRIPILPLGEPGKWDAGMLFTPNHPLVEGDSIKLYYGGADNDHESKQAKMCIGLATLRKDGFASLDAGDKTGVITTRLLNGAKGQLHVNANAQNGSIKVEVLNDKGKVIPGYGRDDCKLVDTDAIDHVVAWSSKQNLPQSDKPIALRFLLNQASLYSFKAGNSF